MDDLYLTIIMPIYNPDFEGFKRCWNSIKNVKVPVEYILVDDGSTIGIDDCINYVKKDTRVKVIRKQNGGVSSARNLGIAKAQGRYLFFVDADDEVTQEFIDLINKKIVGFDSEWIIFDIFLFDIIKKKTFSRRTFEGVQYTAVQGIPISVDQAIKTRVSSKKLNEAWGKLILRDFVMKYRIQFPVGVISGEDAEFNTKILMQVNKIIYYPICGYIYWYDFRHANYRRNKNIEKRLNDVQRAADNILSIIESRLDHDSQADCIREFCINRIIDAALDALSFAQAGQLNKLCKKKIAASVDRYSCFENVSIKDFVGIKRKCYYLAVKYQMWSFIIILAKLKEKYHEAFD